MGDIQTRERKHLARSDISKRDIEWESIAWHVNAESEAYLEDAQRQLADTKRDVEAWIEADPKWQSHYADYQRSMQNADGHPQLDWPRLRAARESEL
ncbi:MAG: hypothetical protein V3V08_23565 [Nannocystaceae bacterium]